MMKPSLFARVARRRSALTTALLPVLFLAACAGPHTPLSVGMKDYTTGVILGAHKKLLAVPPLPPVALVEPTPGFSAPLAGPGTPSTLPVATAPPTCPSADPFAVPERSTTNVIAAPPAPATYHFRNTGSFEVTGANAHKGTYPVDETRTVQHVAKGTTPGSFTFEVAATLGNSVTTTTYTYLPPTSLSSQADQALGSPPAQGLFISKVVTEAEGATDVFAPAGPGLLLLQVPAAPGQNWESSATDPTTGRNITVTGGQQKNTRVDACGRVIDSYTVHLDGYVSQGSSAAHATKDRPFETTFSADYAIATQYGGIAVRDRVKADGVDDAGSYSRVNDASISVVPADPVPLP
jgi:hypothetical protein